MEEEEKKNVDRCITRLISHGVCVVTADGERAAGRDPVHPRQLVDKIQGAFSMSR